MLCWHVACCLCQLVNARCTAADKDQKDITNNRLLTGERDTQVPQRKPYRPSPDPLIICPPAPTCCCQVPSPSPYSAATLQQDSHSSLVTLPQIIICNWIMFNISYSAKHWAVNAGRLPIKNCVYLFNWFLQSHRVFSTLLVTVLNMSSVVIS